MKQIQTHCLASILLSVVFGGVPPLFAREHSGIRGETSIAAGCFQSGLGIICLPEIPFETRVRVYSEAGKLVDDFGTDAQGHFAIGLKSGNYLLVPYLSGYPPGPVPQAIPLSTTVTVWKKEFTSVHLAYLYPWVGSGHGMDDGVVPIPPNTPL